MKNLKNTICDHNWMPGSNVNNDSSGLFFYLVDVDKGPIVCGSILSSVLNDMMKVKRSSKQLVSSINSLSSLVTNKAKAKENDLIQSSAYYAIQTKSWPLVLDQVDLHRVSNRQEFVNGVVFFKRQPGNEITCSVAFSISDDFLSPQDAYALAFQATAQLTGWK